MWRGSGAAIFWLSAFGAAASLVSIAAMEILLAAAALVWIGTRARPIRWPSYFVPLAAFMGTTLLSLAFSPNPGVGWHPIQKFLLYGVGLLAATFVTTESRARQLYKLLLITAAVSGVMAIVQFGMAEVVFLRTGDIGDDPTLLNRITGPLGHWMTFSGVQLLVWCTAIPALTWLNRRWILPVSIVGAAILLSNTRGAWLGAFAGFVVAAFSLPRKLLAAVLIPVVILGIAASPFVYRRIAMSLDQSLATNYSRLAYFTVGLKMIKDKPLFGVGPERIHDEFPNYYEGSALETFFYGHLHNDFLQLGAERGLLCLATFVWFLVELYRSLLVFLRRATPEHRWMIWGSLAALTGFVVAGMTEYNFGDSEVLVLLLFLVSIPFGMESHVQEDPYRQ